MSRRLHCRSVLTPEGWLEETALVLDDAGMIRSLAPGPARYGDERLAGAVIPGMPNLHSHGFQRLVAGLGGQRARGDSFWSWRDAMYRVAARVGPEDLQACMAGLYLELLRGGYTSNAEFHYLHHDPAGAAYDDPAELAARVSAAAGAVGVGLTLLPVLYCRSGFGAEGVTEGQRRFHNTPERYAELLSRCRALTGADRLQRTGVAPHSLRAVNGDDLAALLTLRDAGEPVHIHVAEQPAEVAACLQHLGARPTAWLLENAPVDEHWCLVHATHLDEQELADGAGSGAVAGLCPTTEADLGDGVFRATAWLERGGRFGVGSDSNLRVDAAEELRSLEFSQRLRDGARNLLAPEGGGNGRALWEAAAEGGAQALGQPVGRLAPGRRADLLVLDQDHPMLAGLEGDDLLHAFVFVGDRDMIGGAWVAGEQRLDRGRHPTGDAIASAYHRVLRALRT